MVGRWIAPDPENQILDYLVLDDDTSVTTCLASDEDGWTISWCVRLSAKGGLPLPLAEKAAIEVRDVVHTTLLNRFDAP
jgi:hypothetical protein